MKPKAECAWEEAEESLPSQDDVLHFRLGDYQTAQEFKEEIFQNEALRKWKTGQGQLHLWLDGLDEGRYHINTIAGSLGTSIKNSPVERLRLRLLCRSADWPSLLEDDLKKAWKVEEKENSSAKKSRLAHVRGDDEKGDADESQTMPDPVQVWELAPLRREDARSWAITREVDATHFLDAVDSRKVTALAAKPLTLKFLIEQYEQTGTLPDSRSELYERGCREMCKETNRSRQTSGAVGTLNPDERLAIATRIAGVMLLSNRVAVDLQFDADKASSADIAAAYFAGEFEEVRAASCLSHDGSVAFVADRVEVTRKNVEETVRHTALFSSRGVERMGWRHQTYAEYLAARFLHLRRIGPQRAMEILCVEGRIAPQLREVASWLASLEPEFFDALLENDPEVALHSDVLWSHDGEYDQDQVARRERLVVALLGALEKGQVPAFHLWRSCRALTYSGLAEHILPHLTQPNVTRNLREGALTMCEACQWADVSDAVLKLTLDEEEDDHVRCYAIIAVKNNGDAASRKPLVPLARGEAGASRNLRGLALDAVWPEHLSAQELFQTLVPPHEEGSSHYEHFLSSDLVRGLQIADLPLALNWVREQEKTGYQVDNVYFRWMTAALLRRTWEHLKQPDVTESLAQLMVERLIHYRPLLGSDMDSHIF